MTKSVCLFIICIFLSTYNANAQDKDTVLSPTKNLDLDLSNLVPPKLIQCENINMCARDPKQLEIFVKEFYDWYVAEEKQLRINHQNHNVKHDESYDKFMAKHKVKIHTTLESLLSPDFFKLYMSNRYPNWNRESSPSCQEKNIDPIICQYNLPDKWISPILVKFKSINNNSAEIRVNTLKGEVSNWEGRKIIIPENVLHVSLQIHDGALKIAKVSSNHYNFFEASNEPEIALDAILDMEIHSNPGRLVDFLSNRKKADELFDYSTILTTRVINSIRNAEKKAFKRNCVKGDIEGITCEGLGSHPILCGQDYMGFFYRTAHIDGRRAIIHTANRRLDNIRDTFMMVKDGNNWKIGGINCYGSSVEEGISK